MEAEDEEERKEDQCTSSKEHIHSILFPSHRGIKWVHSRTKPGDILPERLRLVHSRDLVDHQELVDVSSVFDNGPLRRHQPTWRRLHTCLTIGGLPSLTQCSFVRHTTSDAPTHHLLLWMMHDPDRLLYWVKTEGMTGGSSMFVSSRAFESEKPEYFLRTSLTTFLSLFAPE